MKVRGRVGVAVVLAAAVMLSTSCSNAPSTYGPCRHVVVYPPPGGSGYVAAFDWNDDIHAYGEPVSFTVCSESDTVAAIETPPGITVDPARQPLQFDASGVGASATFTVTGSEGAAGQISVRFEFAEGGTWAQPGGPVIAQDGDGWRFALPDQS